MSALVERFGPAPKAFLAVPLVCAFFIDFINAVIITLCLNLWSYQPVVQVQLHSTGDASSPLPTALKPRGGIPGPAALLLFKYAEYSHSSLLANWALRPSRGDAGLAPRVARPRVGTAREDLFAWPKPIARSRGAADRP